MRYVMVYLFVLAAAGVLNAEAKAARVDSLYREALARVGQAHPKASIEAFEQVLKLNWKHAPSHYEIAKLYIELNTPLTRQSARKALNEAMRLDPGNVDFQVTLGELLSRQGFSWHAVRHYDELLQARPGNAEAAYWSGYYAFKDYLRYRDSDIWGLDAARDLERAEMRIRQSVGADPGSRDAYRLLGLLHVESGRPQALISDYKQLLEQSPDDRDALLYIGLGYQALGELDEAHAFYTRALARMSDEERKIMENVELVASPGDRIRMAQAIEYDAMDADWTSVGRDRFWRSLDPLFLTAFNERKIEHYGRFAYANLRFSRPFKEIAGWQTDPGKTIIKFGPRLKRHIVPRSKGIWNNVWHYEGFRIFFENNDGSVNWRFARGSSPGGESAGSLTERVRIVEADGSMLWVTRLRTELGDFYSGKGRRKKTWGETRPPSRHVYRDTPQRYIDPYRELKYQMPRQVAAFQEDDSVRVEFAYAIPKARVRVSGEDGALDLEDGVFLFDERWDEVYSKKMDVFMNWPVFDAGTATKSDSLRRNHVVSFRSLRVAPRQHRLVVEVRDRGTGSIGTFRELRAFGTEDSLLAISDLLLASGIEPKTAFPEGRNDLRVTPNPLHTYGRSEPAYIYLEIYNLKRDRFGRTKYRISYRLTRPEREDIRPERFAALDAPGAGASVEIQTVVTEPIIRSEEDLWGDAPEETVTYRVRYILPERNRISEAIENTPRTRDGAETTVTAQYRGNQKDDFTFLQIDATNAPAGFHKLIVTVKDLYAGQTSERDVVFRVVE